MLRMLIRGVYVMVMLLLLNGLIIVFVLVSGVNEMKIDYMSF